MIASFSAPTRNRNSSTGRRVHKRSKEQEQWSVLGLEGRTFAVECRKLVFEERAHGSKLVMIQRLWVHAPAAGLRYCRLFPLEIRTKLHKDDLGMTRTAYIGKDDTEVTSGARMKDEKGLSTRPVRCGRRPMWPFKLAHRVQLGELVVDEEGGGKKKRNRRILGLEPSRLEF
jgi:hypothetical protein